MEEKSNKILFERKAVNRGGDLVLGLNLPKELVNFLEVEEKSSLMLYGDVNKKGQKYIVVYNPELDKKMME